MILSYSWNSQKSDAHKNYAFYNTQHIRLFSADRSLSAQKLTFININNYSYVKFNYHLIILD